MKPLKVGLVGATGVVGQQFIRLLETVAVAELRPFASASSAGQTIAACGATPKLQILQEGCFDGLDVVFFSSGDEISKQWAPHCVESGAWAIDNSAAFRLDPSHPLVVPEVNFDESLKSKAQIIANPNCSTIQLVVLLNALKPLQLRSVRVATYQAVSGAGRDALEEFSQHSPHSAEDLRDMSSSYFRQPIAKNCIPEIGRFDEDGDCSEENKIRFETKKILGLPDLPVSPFTVRIPVENAHSEAAWVDFSQNVQVEEILTAIEKQEGLVYLADEIPTPLQKSGQDPVFVGRIRQDKEMPQTWLFWIVADNLLKGAALNGFQIMTRLFS